MVAKRLSPFKILRVRGLIALMLEKNAAKVPCWMPMQHDEVPFRVPLHLLKCGKVSSRMPLWWKKCNEVPDGIQ